MSEVKETKPKAPKAEKPKAPEVPKKSRAKRGLSDLGKTVAIYCIQNDTNKTALAETAKVSVSLFNEVCVGEAAPPREWITNARLPVFLRKASVAEHAPDIESEYAAFVELVEPGDISRDDQGPPIKEFYDSAE